MYNYNYDGFMKRRVPQSLIMHQYCSLNDRFLLSLGNYLGK